MAFDSIANLIFNVGANSDDAEQNITRFRALLGTNLDQMAGQFENWSKDVFGELGTVKEAMIGITAAVAAGVVAVAAFAVEATHKFVEYAEAVHKASVMTGLSVEQMSRMKFAADELGVDYDRMTLSIVRFSRFVFEASRGGVEQIAVLKLLGITQADIAAAAKGSIEPMLEKVADGLNKMKDGTVKTAAVVEMFGRGGAAMLLFLRLGSAGMVEMAKHADELGLTLNQKTMVSVLALQASIKTMRAEQEGFDRYLAEHTMPTLTWWHKMEIAMWVAMESKPKNIPQFMAAYTAAFVKAGADIAAMAKLLEGAGGDGKAPPVADPGKVKEAKTEFSGVSEILTRVKTDIADISGESAKAENIILRFGAEMAKASAELAKLHATGKVTAESYATQMLALAALPGKIAELAHAQALKIVNEANAGNAAIAAGMTAAFVNEIAATATKNEQIAALGKSLEDKLAEQVDMTYERQVAGVHREIDAMRAEYVTKGTLTAENQKLLGDLEQARIDRIGRLQNAAFLKEMEAAQQHLGKLLEANMSTEEKLKTQYAMDVQAYSAAQLAKAKIGQGPGEQAALTAQYALNVDALAKRLSTDLQTLYNSQGWQGVFGAKFGEGLRGNEALMKQWQTSTNQSAMMVQVAMQNLEDMGQKAFGQMAQGMGAGIANALVYGKSMSAAMKQAAVSTVESLASQAMSYAIYSLGLAFFDLALTPPNTAGATAAFEAAAIFGSLGLAGAVAGRALSGGSAAGAGGGGAGGGGGRNPSAGYGGGSGGGGSQGQMGGSGGGYVQINVAGHIVGASGIEEFCGMVNDAVQNRDVRLVATQVRQGTLATF